MKQDESVAVAEPQAQENIDATGFRQMTGRFAVGDDLARANCKRTGTVGHYFCGICPEHKLPRFDCGCANLVTKGARLALATLLPELAQHILGRPATQLLLKEAEAWLLMRGIHVVLQFNDKTLVVVRGWLTQETL
jgi:hypothetical protein